MKAKFQDKAFLDNYFRYFGYAFIKDVNTLVPSIPFTFYSFHTMVALGFYFILFFILVYSYVMKGSIERRRTFLWIAIFTLPLPYFASEAGWMVAEMGRQPWTIQDYLPTVAAVSHIDSTSVQVTFWLFAAVFTTLLIAEIRIMTKQIKLGPEEHKEGGM